MTPEKPVLIVDDNEDVRLGLAGILEAKGYQVHTASDGQEAVEAVRKMPFGFVLMDTRMPRKDGVEALREIKKLRPGIPVALITVYDLGTSTQRLLDLGAVAVLTKPLDLANLMGLLNKYCGQP